MSKMTLEELKRQIDGIVECETERVYNTLQMVIGDNETIDHLELLIILELLKDNEFECYISNKGITFYKK